MTAIPLPFGRGKRHRVFVDSELTADDCRAADIAREAEGTPPNCGCVAPMDPPKLVCEAFHLGELRGEVRGYRDGWNWGAVCGTVFGAAMVAVALLLGRHWGGA